jgi:deoxyribonuclease-4
MKSKLNIGISVTLPVNWDYISPEYSNDVTFDKNDDITSNIPAMKNFNSLQIMFSKINLSKVDISNIKLFVKKIKYKYVYIHASYQINMGAEPIVTQDNLYNPGLDIFLTEIKNGLNVGADGIIVHMGKNVKNQHDPDDVYNNMVNFVIQIFNEIKKNKISIKSKKFMILFETPAGSGGEMCSSISEIVNFIQIFKPTDFYDNIGLCIDTCHLFQAGHDLNDKQEIKAIHKILDPIKDKIKVIHLNDSQHSVGKRVDRHEQIGKGHILVDNLIKFILPYKNLPLILETKPPYENQIKSLNEKNKIL